MPSPEEADQLQAVATLFCVARTATVGVSAHTVIVAIGLKKGASVMVIRTVSVTTLQAPMLVDSKITSIVPAAVSRAPGV